MSENAELVRELDTGTNMLNKRPIFINAFARGGSNILMNLLLSHPGVCLSDGETHKVFKGTKWESPMRRWQKRLMYELPIRVMTQQNLFAPDLLQPRKPVSENMKRYIDKIFYEGRFHAMIATHNLYKFEDVRYTREELAKCRLLTKGLNGTVFAVDVLREMYPDAVFFGLVRNGLAICEGYVRRGWSAKKVGHIYKTVVQKMRELENGMPNYHLIRYEEMVHDPLAATRQVYDLADLDFSLVPKIRLQSKQVTTADGRHELLKGQDRQVFWYDPNELHNHIRSDVNENQIRKLDSVSRKEFLAETGKVMQELGYLTE